MRRLCGEMVLFVLLALPAARAEEILENAFATVRVDPARGGAVTAMHYRKATTFPLIADKGAGVAGTGLFLAGRIEVGEERLSLTHVHMKVQRRADAAGRVLVLTARLPPPASTLRWTRTFTMGVGESGVRFKDTFRNEGADLAFSVGIQAEQQPEPWRKNLRCWYGGAARHFTSVAPAHAGQVVPFEPGGQAVFWRVVSQYGVGALWVTRAPVRIARAVHHLPATLGCPARFDWTTEAIPLARGQEVSITGEVLIDEGGRRSNDPRALLASNRTIAMVDVRAAGMPGDRLPGAVTLVAAEKAAVRVAVTQFRLENGARTGERSLARFEAALTPGRAQFHHFDVLPDKAGLLYVEAVVADEDGNTLIRSAARSLIDGRTAEGDLQRVWRFYTRRLPEATYKGTWEEIGRRALRVSVRPAATAESKKRLAFMEKHFPFYARMLRGAAAARKIDPARLAYAPPARPQRFEACMAIFFNGPDGPLNCYSKERSGASYAGLKYAKIIPDEGYRFHAYSPGGPMVAWGINSAGLSMTAASLNCDGETKRIADKRLAEWRAKGRFTAPGPWPWMVLAGCKNVDEAIALITNPEAPVAGEVNVLLVDREGNAAKVQGWGITHHVTRYDPGAKGFFVVGNYPVETPEGLFRIGAWGWAANTMMRERFLLQVAGRRRGHIRLADAFWIMETHAAGGMCQHLYDNTGALFSNTSCIAVPRTGDLWLSHGPPCRVRYHRYRLSED